MNEEIFFIRLRDCFNAGYTMPQFCIDNGIKKPLFVAFDASCTSFIWEIYAQFKYDKRISADFVLIQGEINSINFSVGTSASPLTVKNIKDLTNFNEFDRIILLTNKNIQFNQGNLIPLNLLVNQICVAVYLEIPILHLLQRHSGVKLIQLNFPSLTGDENNTERENRLLKEAGTWVSEAVVEELKKDMGVSVPEPYSSFDYNNEDVVNLLELPTVDTNFDGSTKLVGNENNPFMKIVDGKRLTADQPQNYKNKIYFVGNCIYYGFGTPFDKTLESHLQRLLNAGNIPYRVENESQPVSGRYQDVFYNLNKLPLNAGDIVFVNVQNLISPKLPFVNTIPFFKRPHDYGEVFIDNGHINERGHRLMAENLFKILTQNNFFQNTKFNYPAPPPPPHRYGIPKENFYGSSNFNDNKDLEIYKQKLREKQLKIGATVMNCNPFTLGHKSLIKYAASRVHKLYIFVVEEDKSEFKFEDRLKLVQAGVKEFPNVEVIPSGKFIISQQTFSGYFNKAELQNVAVDSSQDVEIFANEIAPTLGINIRFAGEEPEDTVTRQYNENMKNILPRYGIDFCEIPRKTFNGEVISAKSVRAALKVGDFEKIAKLVPKTTLKFLIENYSTPPRHGLTIIKIIGGIFIWRILQSVINVRIAVRR